MGLRTKLAILLSLMTGGLMIVSNNMNSAFAWHN
jgi:hypothetical protein